MRKLLTVASIFFPVMAVAQTLPARTPGLWQSTTSVTGAGGQPLPNATDVVTVSCVDAANDQTFFTSEESRCSRLAISGGGGTYRIDGTCAEGGHLARISEALTYASPAQVSLRAVLNGTSGPITIAATLVWRGPCLPGMQPGDEGNIVAGAFSKADNINDVNNR